MLAHGAKIWPAALTRNYGMSAMSEEPHSYKGNDKCLNCVQNGTRCVFDTRDGRKEKGNTEAHFLSRAAVKAETEALSERVRQLEQLLKQSTGEKEISGKVALPEHVPGEASVTTGQSLLFHDVHTLPDMEIVVDVPDGSPTSSKHASKSDTEEQISTVKNLVPSPIRFDMSSGRVRYFGPTTSMNVLTTNSPRETSERREAHWPMCMLLRDLTIETHDYLMDLYWTCHNSVLHLIHSDAFYHDLERGGTQFYSVFLHLTVLASGFKYADKSRRDIQQLVATPGTAGSTIHEKARVFAKLEQDRPGGIPSIQAFSLLADIEFNIGRDDIGWLFAGKTGMSLRLVSDVGLHVDPTTLCLTEKEAQIRHMVLWASLVHDMHWSLYLGRPTTLKLSDIAPVCLSRDFTKLIFCRPSGHEKKLTTRIYEALLKLMGLISPLCDRCVVLKPSTTAETYFRMASLDEELNSWRSELLEDLRWPPRTWDMPSSFYLLHTQYYVALILLHRPFVQYEPPEQSSDGRSATGDSKTHFTKLSRSVCAENAGMIVEIFEKYREHLDLAKVYGTGLAHAGTAATALMGEVILQVDDEKQSEMISQLCSLRKTISLMAPTYPPGILMANVVDGYMAGLNHAADPGTDLEAEIIDRGCQLPQGNASLSGMSFAAIGGKEHANIIFPFTPTEAASDSVQGLPFLPSSVMEGLNAHELSFVDQIGYSDYGFSWESHGTSN
ncbi:unnamed protein product [Clonostachys solani]|uniref:Xylanolytic transcriptional activator regulatory domain-containing protein n=1 Tax=Clonostachys solani TaxID=160281 RepID=A0A9P0EE65_9HYPO|nr:unnamed protein product [Clonostachys solani]